MLSIDSLLSRLATDFPDIVFREANSFSWAPSTQTITFTRTEPHSVERLLHELGHAQLDHTTYDRDIDLIGMERDAWQLARTDFLETYSVPISTDVVEDHMDTYREWLHARSTCPYCSATGLQTGKNMYKCLACLKTWQVNEARVCALRRYKK